MQFISSKIRSLRKGRGMTQEQLAEVLSVSAQSVSKWENNISAPDIELLPMIARYFGITMDEFFNYRLDALNYKERFIRFMADNGVLQFGTFSLKSGRKRISGCHDGLSGNIRKCVMRNQFVSKETCTGLMLEKQLQ